VADYRRWFVPGGTYFFTLVTANRAPLFLNPVARRLLGDLLRRCRFDKPFEINAIVLLPEHLHAIWTLPTGDDAYPARWGWIKKEFTKAWLAAGGTEQAVSTERSERGDRGVWQTRYWEHTIVDEYDFDRHFNYIHYNPVKHGHVRCPADWKDSSFHRWVSKRVYEPDWGCSNRGVLSFDDLNQTAMEMGIE
jgi:putative transposase